MPMPKSTNVAGALAAGAVSAAVFKSMAPGFMRKKDDRGNPTDDIDVSKLILASAAIGISSLLLLELFINPSPKEVDLTQVQNNVTTPVSEKPALPAANDQSTPDGKEAKASTNKEEDKLLQWLDEWQSRERSRTARTARRRDARKAARRNRVYIETEGHSSTSGSEQSSSGSEASVHSSSSPRSSASSPSPIQKKAKSPPQVTSRSAGPSPSTVDALGDAKPSPPGSVSEASVSHSEGHASTVQETAKPRSDSASVLSVEQWPSED